jgi:hypothetical protein
VDSPVEARTFLGDPPFDIARLTETPAEWEKRVINRESDTESDANADGIESDANTEDAENDDDYTGSAAGTVLVLDASSRGVDASVGGLPTDDRASGSTAGTVLAFDASPRGVDASVGGLPTDDRASAVDGSNEQLDTSEITGGATAEDLAEVSTTVKEGSTQSQAVSLESDSEAAHSIVALGRSGPVTPRQAKDLRNNAMKEDWSAATYRDTVDAIKASDHIILLLCFVYAAIGKNYQEVLENPIGKSRAKRDTARCILLEGLYSSMGEKTTVLTVDKQVPNDIPVRKDRHISHAILAVRTVVGRFCSPSCSWPRAR